MTQPTAVDRDRGGGWLREQDAEGRDRWPTVLIDFHGKHDPRSIDQQIAATGQHPSDVVA